MKLNNVSNSRGTAALSSKKETIIIDGATDNPVEVKLPVGSIAKITAEANALGLSINDWFNSLLAAHIDQNTPRYPITAKELDRLCNDCAEIIEGEMEINLTNRNRSHADILKRWKKERGGLIAARVREGATMKSAEFDLKLLDADAAMLERLLSLLAETEVAA